MSGMERSREQLKVDLRGAGGGVDASRKAVGGVRRMLEVGGGAVGRLDAGLREDGVTRSVVGRAVARVVGASNEEVVQLMLRDDEMGG